MFLIIKQIDGKIYRLCQDNYWRWFANYGTFPECVKEYKVLGPALLRATRVKGQAVQIPDGMSVDACGGVVGHNLTEFVVS